MKTIEIMSSMLVELGKLILRSDEKSSNLVEGALKFIGLNPHSFSEVEKLTQKLQSPNSWEEFYPLLYEKEVQQREEPYYLPFTPILNNDPNTQMGFLIHIFKGEQDISPLPLKEITIGAKQYHRIVYTLKHDLKRLNRIPDIETWLYLLERYTKWIPASSSCPNISLYQYIRFKMALAACIDEQDIENSPLGLFAVEITGRDKFLCGIETGNNLDIFKGAAYYFQLLRQNLMEDFLKMADVPLCNCLVQETDRFLLLVNPDTKEKLLQRAIEHEEFLCQMSQGKLSLSVHFEPISLKNLKEKNFIKYFEKTWTQLQKKGTQPFASLISSQKHSLVFGPMEKNRDQQKKLCESLQSLGRELEKTRWIEEDAVSREEQTLSEWEKMLAYFGKSQILWSKNPPKKNNVNLYRFGNTDFFPCEGRGFVFSDIVPYLINEEMPFPQAYWCFVHFQIDAINNAEFSSPGTFFTLKEHLQDFFKTYLLALLREKKYRKYTYMTYIEHNFFTLVCSPQIALGLISQVHKKFRQFAEDRYTLSGRVAVFDAEYPLQKALYQEYQNFSSQESLRNKIVVFDEVFPWSFLDNIQKAQEKIASISKGKDKSFLYFLWGISNFFQKQEKSKKNLILWRHIIQYYFNKIRLGDSFEKHILEGEKGPIYLNMALEWNAFMSLEP